MFAKTNERIERVLQIILVKQFHESDHCYGYCECKPRVGR